MCGFDRSPSSSTAIGQLPGLCWTGYWERFDLDEKYIEI